MTDDRERNEEGTEGAEQDDTEGHSLSTYEYGRLVSRERSQDLERAAREARMREGGNRNKR